MTEFAASRRYAAGHGVSELLGRGTLEVTGRLVEASNGTFYGQVSDGSRSLACVYKPVRGERPLWDFPDGTLAGRERAAYLVSEAAGWHVVPPTVIADGPFGPGMVQLWVDIDPALAQIAVVPAGDDPEGWFSVVDAVDARDREVTLLHRDTPPLRTIALFDAVVNNADRKGGHLLPVDETVLGCDHGLTFHVEDKLRTVLWGWAGEALDDDDRQRLESLSEKVTSGPLRAALSDLISADEIAALSERLDLLLTTGRMPTPGDRWPTIPWPPV
ncbi:MULTISPECIES: SCO1664 family protein [Mumia]|uniref:SCO1664 family protein n=1 Tax=Mumia TaxID=1546255 RepID=UPI00142079A8|nr:MULTISPECIES: SCO1664 family protein [unclassified Mumia]QMW64683.1 SCO1664 family protein [Mumia sp. ZJ1417]